MEVPELTSFASLVRFALDLEARAAALYESPGFFTEDPAAAAAGKDLAAFHRERARRIERARQQFLNEVVLEPVGGLDARAYAVDSDESRASPVERGRALEEASARFYEDSAQAAKAVLTEMARTFRALAAGNRENVSRLGKLVRA